MMKGRVRDTRQKDLTPQQKEEKEIANMEFFPGDISQKYFQDRNEIQQFIMSLCRQKGFTPCAQQRKTNDFGQYFCECSGLPKSSSRLSKKTGCPFFINISKTKNGFHVSSMDARHNHQLVNMDLCVDKTIEDQIHILHSSGLKPHHILKVLETRGISLPTNLISGIAYKHKIQNISEEFEYLSTYMAKNGGVCVPYDYIGDKFQTAPIRCAIWTQNIQEKANLEKYGDVIMFDSTESNLNNEWLTIPISVIDKNRHILPAGLCFVAFETEEVITFLCREIFSDNNIRIINQTIITDEDQTYKSIISKLMHQPKHVLCALHKKKNFHKYLKLSELSKEEKNQASQYFNTICFSKNKQTVEKCFNSLFLLKDSAFVVYCRKLYSEKEYFSKAYINEFTLGYNTSSVAESMNRMIKINTEGRKLSLLEFRREFENAHQRAYQNALYSDSKKQFPVNFPFTEIVPNVSKVCVLEIYRNIQKSVKYSFSSFDNNTKFEVRHYKNLEEVNFVKLGETITCTCNQSVLFGYPCVHIINVLLNVRSNINCINLIYKHWITNDNCEMNFLSKI